MSLSITVGWRVVSVSYMKECSMILNTTQNPMVWQDMHSLQQLGTHKNHLAIQYNGQVLFVFGESIPVSSLFLSDPIQAMKLLHLHLPLWEYINLLAHPCSPYSPSPVDLTPSIIYLPAPSQTSHSGSPQK